MGKSRPAVANALRLLHLPQEVAGLVAAGRLTAGHARAILAFEGEEEQRQVARAAVERELPVRALEKMAKTAKKEKKEAASPAAFRKTPFTLRSSWLYPSRRAGGSRLRKKGDKGVLQIEFYGREDLQELANRLAPR